MPRILIINYVIYFCFAFIDYANSWESQITTTKLEPITAAPQSISWDEENRIVPTRPAIRPPSETISEAQLRIVGERVLLRCDAPGAQDYDSRIFWEKFNGENDEMPQNYRINDTTLIIPRLHKEDAGIYRCLVERIDGNTHMSTVELKVGDYVPTFNGHTILEVTPLERDEWQRLQIELSLRATASDGTIYHAELNSPQNEPKLFHNIALKRGHVVYTYDIGAGTGRLQSNDPIEIGQWSKIIVKNNPIYLSVNGQETNYTANRQVPALLDSGDGIAHIGGLSPDSKHYERFEEKANYKGSISRLVINEQLIDIGDSATSPPELTLSLSSNECFDEPCQNGGQCLPAHEHEGYRCECPQEYTGNNCQFRNRFCTDKIECTNGICVEEETGNSQCVCPWHKYGPLCELEGFPPKIQKQLDEVETPSQKDSSFRFNGRTSFMSIPSPPSSRHFRLSLNLTPAKTNTSQLIAYVGSGYNSRRSDYMALTLENEHFTAIYKTKDGREEVKSLERAKVGQSYTVGFLRTGKQIEIAVNGKSAVTVVEAPIFSSGTALYIGGLPPGMRPNEEVTEHEFFHGCAAQILVNRELVRMNDERFSTESGDLRPCVGDPNEMTVSLINTGQLPQAYTRPKTTYATMPKRLPIKDVPIHVIETRPDDALSYTVISSTTTSTTQIPPTNAENTEEEIQSTLISENSDEFVEFEPLLDEDSLEISTIPPTTTQSTKIPIILSEIDESLEPIKHKPIISNVQSSPTPTKSTELSTSEPTTNQKPKITQSDPLPFDAPINSELEISKSDESPQIYTTTLAPFEETNQLPEMGPRPTHESHLDPYLKKWSLDRACRGRICGEHGICEPVNVTHVVCSCRDYYTGPECDIFKPIEYAARFEGNAFIVFSVDEFPHLTSDKHEVIEIELRTTADYGVIFWQEQDSLANLAGEDYISLGLNDGYLVYSYELGGGAAQIISARPINDGKLHKIKAERQGRNGSLIIDNEMALNGTSSGILAMLNVEGHIYMGGLPNLSHMTSGIHTQNFIGCIANFRLNNNPLDLMANAIDGRNVKPCETWPTEIKKWVKDIRRTRKKLRKY